MTHPRPVENALLTNNPLSLSSKNISCDFVKDPNYPFAYAKYPGQQYEDKVDIINSLETIDIFKPHVPPPPLPLSLSLPPTLPLFLSFLFYHPLFYSAFCTLLVILRFIRVE